MNETVIDRQAKQFTAIVIIFGVGNKGKQSWMDFHSHHSVTLSLFLSFVSELEEKKLPKSERSKLSASVTHFYCCCRKCFVQALHSLSPKWANTLHSLYTHYPFKPGDHAPHRTRTTHTVFIYVVFSALFSSFFCCHLILFVEQIVFDFFLSSFVRFLTVSPCPPFFLICSRTYLWAVYWDECAGRRVAGERSHVVSVNYADQ